MSFGRGIPNTFIVDEFMGSASGVDTVGDLGWNTDLTGSIANTGESAPGHPGFIQLQSNTTANDDGHIHLTHIHYQDYDEATFVVRPRSGLTNMYTRIGVFSNITLVGAELSLGIYFSFNPAASPNWRCVARNDAGITVIQTSVPYELNKWYQLQMKFTPPNNVNQRQVTFAINGQQVGTIKTNLEESDGSGESLGLAPGFAIETTNTTEKTIDIDHFSAWLQNLTQRY